MKNIVHFLNITSSSVDVETLTKFCLDFMDSYHTVEFSDDEILLVNEFIKDNDSQSMIDFLKEKKQMLDEVVKDIVLKDIDSLWQFIMEQSYELWIDNSISREEFLSKLSDYERIAVKFGNFNFQVENGGLMQWDYNGYSDDLEDLLDFLIKSDYSKKERFIDILESFSIVKESINNLSKENDWYDEDVDTRWKSLEKNEDDYCSFKEDWIEYFENYLFENITDVYLKKIKEYNLSKVDI